MGNNRDLERFMRRVDKSQSGCWLWTGAMLPRGYGRFYFKGKPRYSHRVALELLNGEEVSDRELVMHRCDNPRCVNPEHLKVGNQTENMRDAAAKGRTVRVQDWRGMNNPKAKLTPDQIQGIHRAIAAGETNRSIAERYGVTKARIGQFKKAGRETEEY